MIGDRNSFVDFLSNCHRTTTHNELRLYAHIRKLIRFIVFQSHFRSYQRSSICVLGAVYKLQKTTNNMVKLLTQNMWINHVTFKTSTSNKVHRLTDFTSHIDQFDIITLQEVFSHNFLSGVDFKAMMSSEAKKHGFDYFAVGRAPSYMNQDSGLMILSKLPIVSTEFVSFSSYSWFDMIVDKGFLYVKIQVTPDQHMHVITTHMDAHRSDVRSAQVDQISQWIVDHLENEVKNDLLIMTGDWNIRVESEEYDHLLNTFPEFKNVYLDGPYPPTHQCGICIDHVLVNKFAHLVPSIDGKVYKIENLTGSGERANEPISDHSGVSIEVTLA